MASNNDHRNNSPMHLGLTGQFSPEDIQELLGVMGDGSDHHPGGADGGSQSGALAPVDGYGHTDTNKMYMEESGTTTASSTSGQPAIPAPGSAHISVAMGHAPNGPPEEAKAQARSERKRSREKQRRSDVNKQFSDLTQLLQKIDAEDVNEEDVKNGTTSNRVTFNPSNRVDLIARTIVLLERLHEANKRRKTEIGSLQQQLDEAKKAGEDTAAKLKEAMLAPPGQQMSKQIMMMVPMMMSSDGSGAQSALPMMNPYMPQAAMPQHYCPMPPQAMTAAVAAPPLAGTMVASAPGQAPGQAPTPAAAGAPAMMPAQPMAAAHPQQPAQPGQPQAPQAAFPYMMQPMAGGGGYMMQHPMAGHSMAGQPMAMVPQAMPLGVQQGAPQENQNGHQEQKDSSPGLNGGSNLAHCA